MLAIGIPFAGLFRTAENNRDFIGLIKAAFACDEDINGNHDSQQNQADDHDEEQRADADFMPDAVHYRLAEGGIDHQQN